MPAIYDKIGRGYDTTRRADAGILQGFVDLLGIQPGRNYVDIACGTGNYTSRIAEFGGNWFAFDQSQNMLREAWGKSSKVSWQRFNVERTAYPDGYFHGAMCSLAIHHFPDLASAFREIARIMTDDGVLVIFTSSSEQMRHYWLNEYFPGMMRAACRQMPSLDAVAAAMGENGLEISAVRPFFVTRDLQDFFLYCGKQRPEMYLSAAVRQGISSFRNLCPQAELKTGLQRLKQDIESGEVKKVIDGFSHPSGDYCFLAAGKVN